MDLAFLGGRHDAGMGEGYRGMGGTGTWEKKDLMAIGACQFMVGVGI